MPNEKVKYFKPYDEIKEKIVYVKDKDVLGYDSANIYAFTFNLFRLEKFGLSNNFIYMDDDFFFGKKVNKSNFFYYEDNEKRVVPSLQNAEFQQLSKDKILELYKALLQNKDTIGTQSFMAWIFSLTSTELFFLQRYPKIPIINPTPTHNAISYNIQDLKEIYDLIMKSYKYANETLHSLERHILTLQTQHFVDLYALNIKHRKIHSINFNVVPIKLIDIMYLYTELFALNTGGDENYTEHDFRLQKEIMQTRFPTPTPYEIPDNTIKVDNKSIELKADNSNKNKRINAISSNEENQDINPNEENKNKINDLNRDDAHLIEIENKLLVDINSRQTLIIKISNGLIILMTLFIITLLYLYFSSKSRNKNKYSNDFESKIKLEIVD